MKLLELFKGTGSVGKVFTELYPDSEVYSLDILKKYKPTHCGDILEWDYKQFKEGHFDIIWASPECKVFSVLQHGWLKTGKRGAKGKWDSMEHLNKVRGEHGQFVKRTLEIIEYFKPTAWFVENPWASAMKDLDIMKDIPSIRFDYCRFGYDYQKPTRIWTNKKLEEHKCICKSKHKYRLGISNNPDWTTKPTDFKDKTDIHERYSIPPKLIKYLLT
tara:strand:+ start:246 stop:896 length:651 start_codon:yes stop_codon:yes gene_type:complete